MMTEETQEQDIKSQSESKFVPIKPMKFGSFEDFQLAKAELKWIRHQKKV